MTHKFYLQKQLADLNLVELSAIQKLILVLLLTLNHGFIHLMKLLK